MRFALVLLASLALGACALVYKLPTRQGNVIEQDELDALQLGMSREQVQFLLGTPVASSALRPDRWDYFGYYKNPRGKVFSRTVSLYFEGDSLARIEGQKPPAGASAGTRPDLETLEKEERKAKAEDERAREPPEGGIVITPQADD
jgi:outer membrane protein assembly factor BamE